MANKRGRWIMSAWVCPNPCGYDHDPENPTCGSCGSHRPLPVGVVRLTLKKMMEAYDLGQRATETSAIGRGRRVMKLLRMEAY